MVQAKPNETEPVGGPLMLPRGLVKLINVNVCYASSCYQRSLPRHRLTRNSIAETRCAGLIIGIVCDFVLSIGVSLGDGDHFVFWQIPSLLRRSHQLLFLPGL